MVTSNYSIRSHIIRFFAVIFGKKGNKPTCISSKEKKHYIVRRADHLVVWNNPRNKVHFIKIEIFSHNSLIGYILIEFQKFNPEYNFELSSFKSIRKYFSTRIPGVTWLYTRPRETCPTTILRQLWSFQRDGCDSMRTHCIALSTLGVIPKYIRNIHVKQFSKLTLAIS